MDPVQAQHLADTYALAYANSAKFIGAGLAAIGMGAAAIGVGTIFGNFLSGALRNPSAADGGGAHADRGETRADELRGVHVGFGEDVGRGLIHCVLFLRYGTGDRLLLDIYQWPGWIASLR